MTDAKVGTHTALREQIIAEIMKLVRPAPTTPGRRPTIDELEKMLNADENSVASINPDGSVSLRPPPSTVGDVADAVLRILDAQADAAPSMLAALKDIAAQKTTKEIEHEYGDQEGDFEGAYDKMIEVARNALALAEQSIGEGE